MTEKLSIVYGFDSTYKPGEGIPRYMGSLGEYYSSQGHDVSYIVGESVISDPSIYPVTRTFSVGSNGNHVDIPIPISRKKADVLLDEIRPDILHIQMPYGPVGWRLINRAGENTAVIGTFHTVPNSIKDNLGHYALGLASMRSQRRFDQIISVSPSAREVALATYGVGTRVIPCPVNLERFGSGRRLEEYDDGKTNIIFMGRLEERKGCQHLISAVSKMEPTLLPKIRLLIAGKGPLLSELQLQAKRQGIEDVVSFLGFIDDSMEPDLFASADLAVFPATGGESFGIVLTEAIASGAGIVLGGDNPGYRYVLGDDRFLFKPTDEDALARRFEELVTDPAGRLSLHSVQQKDKYRFGVSAVAAQVMDAYEAGLSIRRS